MATSNTTLASLWVEDGTGSPVKSTLTPSKTIVTSDGVLKYYHDTGLEPIAKEAGILDSNGALSIKLQNQRTVQAKGAKIPIIAVPVQSPAKMSPMKLDGHHILPKAIASSPVILGTPNRVGATPAIITASPQTPRQVIQNVKMESPQWQLSNVRKRPGDYLDSSDFFDSKRMKKGEKGGKGLRHFSMKVCEKVQRKGVTSYNEVADELVAEFSDPRNMSPTDQAYDQKNIRRRVYDALNVLMAMNIISKEKKEIKWIGLPTNSAQECQNLEVDKQRLLERINYKTQQLQELILQQIAFKNLVQRNRDLQRTQGPPPTNSAIHLPYIIVNTSKKTVIDCSISNDKYEYLFNFDNTFEIHDDIEVLKRMGMAYGLEKGQAKGEHIKMASKLVPKALEPYVLELGQGKSSTTVMPGPSGVRRAEAAASSARIRSAETLALPLGATSDATDAEVAMANQNALSRQSSVGSFSDMAPSRGATDTPSEMGFSDDDESERSSPVE